MRIDPAADPQKQEARSDPDAFKKTLAKVPHKAGPPKPAPGKVTPKAAPRPSPRMTPHAAAKAAQRTRSEAHVFSTQLARSFQRDVKGKKTLAAARGEAEVTSQSRTNDRTQGMAGQAQQMKQRIGELLARELGRLPDAPTTLAPSREHRRDRQEPLASSRVETRALAEPGPPANATPEVSSVTALIEKVELFVRSNRPTLSLSLGGALSGQLEIEKVGPGKVALTLRGGASKDAKTPERIRQALAARGLTVTRLRIA